MISNKFNEKYSWETVFFSSTIEIGACMYVKKKVLFVTVSFYSVDYQHIKL